MALVSVLRFYFMVLHVRSRPSATIVIARKKEMIFVVGAVTHMGLMATWTLVAFWVSDDSFTHFLPMIMSIACAFGMCTRSFAIDRGINAQILAAFIPLCAAMIVAGGWYPTMIFVERCV